MHRIETRAILRGIQVAVTDNHGAGIALYRSVTTDDVVVTDALKLSVLMPLIYLLGR